MTNGRSPQQPVKKGDAPPPMTGADAHIADAEGYVTLVAELLFRSIASSCSSTGESARGHSFSSGERRLGRQSHRLACGRSRARLPGNDWPRRLFKRYTSGAVDHRSGQTTIECYRPIMWCDLRMRKPQFRWTRTRCIGGALDRECVPALYAAKSQS